MSVINYGYITNIQTYTIHDGPGIRTEIFFKGCTLRCPWCSNPETIKIKPEIGVYPSKCITEEKCGYCKTACPYVDDSPVQFDWQGLIQPVIMKRGCDTCLKCADACPGSGLKIWGKRYSVEELMTEIRKDVCFYNRSGGGVTLNGGEVLVQHEFAAELLRRCKEENIGTCVETALHVPNTSLMEIVPYTDYLICDIKHIHPERHRELTGSTNTLILENIKCAVSNIPYVVVRTPVVCGFNDEDENIVGIADFIKNELGNKVLQYQLLPYRKMGTEKYDSLGEAYPMGDYVPPEREVWETRLLYLTELAQSRGVNAVAGSNKKWFE